MEQHPTAPPGNRNERKGKQRLLRAPPPSPSRNPPPPGARPEAGPAPSAPSGAGWRDSPLAGRERTRRQSSTEPRGIPPPLPHTHTHTPRSPTGHPRPAVCRGRPGERGGGRRERLPPRARAAGLRRRRYPRGRGSPRTWSDMAGRGAGGGLGWAAAGLGSFLCPQRKHRPRRGRDFLCA